jgi:hypothetical protein
MAFTLNGFGTTYYGNRFLPDGTYITTKWVVVLFVPIIPVGSFRVVQAGPTYGAHPYQSQSLTVHQVPLDKDMVLRTYALLVGSIAVLFFLAWLADYLDR